MISEHVSLAVAALQQVEEPARERIRATAMAAVSAFENDGKVRVPGVARCIVGTKPDREDCDTQPSQPVDSSEEDDHRDRHDGHEHRDSPAHAPIFLLRSSWRDDCMLSR